MKIRNRLPDFEPIIIGFSLLLIGVAQITALWAITRQLPLITKSSSVVEAPVEFSPQLYWLEIVNNRIRLVAKTSHTAATSPEIALKDALTQLLERSPSELTTTIPRKTRLLDSHISENGIYVDLSEEFSRGGGSSSMIYRVGQVLFTATSIDPQAPVYLSIAGQPLNEEYPLGGEGLLLDYPLTRQKFTRDFLSN